MSSGRTQRSSLKISSSGTPEAAAGEVNAETAVALSALLAALAEKIPGLESAYERYRAEHAATSPVRAQARNIAEELGRIADAWTSVKQQVKDEDQQS